MAGAFASMPSVRAAEAYLIVDNQTGHVLASKNANKKLQVGSLTKVATAVVALDWVALTNARIDDMVTINSTAIQAGGINPVGLQENDTLSVRDLLYCALMASDNTAATALAQYVGARLPNSEHISPEKNFVANMNALARQLRMKNTLFLNPHGLDNMRGALPHSTAADLARLTQYAYTKSSFTFFVSQKTREIHVTRGGAVLPLVLTNTNELLGKDEIDGVKTGKTARAGECLILSADQRPDVTRDGNAVSVTPKRIIVVILGSSARFNEGLALMTQGWALYNEWAAGGRKTSPRQSL